MIFFSSGAPHLPKKCDGGTLLVAYKGVSMNPTLDEAEVLEVAPYKDQSVQAGDVVYFQVPGKGHRVVHRVIRIIPEGIITRGDNNPGTDACFLQRADILGQVVGAWRGPKRHPVLGGQKGLFLSRRLRWRAGVRRSVISLLQPTYRLLARWGIGWYLLPFRWRPRLVLFQKGAEKSAQLMIGHHRVGFYDPERRRWRIQPPFRLFIEEDALPKMNGGA